MSDPAASARLRCALDGVGCIGPGINSWTQLRSIFNAAEPYHIAPTLIPPPATLPPAERRRTGRVVNLALAAGYQATADSGCDLTTLATVFSSSGADSNNCHEICQTLASADRQLSPTRFHNSVHNVTAGYWGIATRDMAPSTVLCAYDASFSAGLLEALVQLTGSAPEVLLIAYDLDYPSPLHEKRPIPDSLAVALLLRRTASARSLARLSATLGTEVPEQLENTQLETLRRQVPAARALPLLRQLARGGHSSTRLEYLPPLSLQLQIEPCA
jgi:Beta-ketoacyl synthase, N-terminal domain